MSEDNSEQDASSGRVGPFRVDDKPQIAVMIVDGFIILGSAPFIVVTMVLWYFGAWGIFMELGLMATLTISLVLAVIDIVTEVRHGKTGRKESQVE